MGNPFKISRNLKFLKKDSMWLLENDAILTKGNMTRESGSLQQE